MVSGSPTVSVVIRALNEARHLPRLLHGLAHQSYGPLEVVLVDSGSSDATVEIAREWGAKVVHIAPEDFSFGRSLNIGCAAASGDLLLLASAHVYPQSVDWVARLVEPFTSDDELAISYGGQDGDHTSNFGERRLLRSWFPEQSNLDQQDPFCNNANCMVRSDLWADRPYDESLPGLEDIAWASRVTEEGFRIAYVGDARVVHLHSERMRSIVNRYRREAVAFREIFGHGELDAFTATRWFAGNLSIDLREASQEHRPVRSSVESVKFRAGQYLGAVQGHRSGPREIGAVVTRMFRSTNP